VGDVSGKGTAAALYGAVAIGIMRSLAPQKLQPAEMLKQMNQLVGERRIEGRFMTACFATWQKGRQKLRWQTQDNRNRCFIKRDAVARSN